jgi:hypothetical protein
MDRWSQMLIETAIGCPEDIQFAPHIERVRQSLIRVRDDKAVTTVEAYVFWIGLSEECYAAGFMAVPDSDDELDKMVVEYYDVLVDAQGAVDD